MKGKLIKISSESYKLVSLDGDFVIKGKLSLKNCQAIERGYDLDELAKNYLLNKWLPNTNKEDRELWYLTNDWSKEVVKIIKNFYIELMGDKKYSEEDVKKAMNVTLNYETKRDAESYQEKIDFLKSLQQTEWDVSFNPEEKDSEGCLILKRI